MLASEILTAGPGAANLLALNEAALRGGAARNVIRPDLDHDGPGSKAWYEVYERYIFEIEREEAEGLKNSRERYRLGALCRSPLGDERQPPFEEGGRAAPPSRLNITIGSVMLTAWLAAGLVHYIAGVALYAEGPAVCWQPPISRSSPPRSSPSSSRRLATCGAGAGRW